MSRRPSLFRRLADRLLTDDVRCYQVTVLEQRDGHLTVVSRYDMPRRA